MAHSMTPLDTEPCYDLPSTVVRSRPRAKTGGQTSMIADAGTFGVLLRRYRHGGALSQEALAERAGLSVQAISQLERGARHTPRLETVQRLAAALGLDAAARTRSSPPRSRPRSRARRAPRGPPPCRARSPR